MTPDEFWRALRGLDGPMSQAASWLTVIVILAGIQFVIMLAVTAP